MELSDSMHQASRLLIVSLFILITVGCGSSDVPQDLAMATAARFEEAKAQVFEKKFSEALIILTEIEKSGVFRSTQVSELYLLRARCFIETSDLKQALLDIDSADRSDGDAGQVHELRYLYWTKMGVPSKAQDELRLARQANPKLVLP